MVQMGENEDQFQVCIRELKTLPIHEHSWGPIRWYLNTR